MLILHSFFQSVTTMVSTEETAIIKLCFRPDHNDTLFNVTLFFDKMHQVFKNKAQEGAETFFSLMTSTLKVLKASSHFYFYFFYHLDDISYPQQDRAILILSSLYQYFTLTLLKAQSFCKKLLIAGFTPERQATSIARPIPFLRTKAN